MSVDRQLGSKSQGSQGLRARGGYSSDDISKVGVVVGGWAAEPGGGDDAMTITIALFLLYRLHVHREDGVTVRASCPLVRPDW